MTKLNAPELPSLSLPLPLPLTTLLLPSLSLGQSQVTSARATAATTTNARAPLSRDTSRENRRAYLRSAIELALAISAEDFSFLDDYELALTISAENFSFLDDNPEIHPPNPQ